MATLIGVVSQVIGEVYAVAGDGTRRPLSEGDRVFAGEQIVTGAAGSIAVAMNNGQQLTLGRDSSLNLNEQMLAGSSSQQAPVVETPPAAPSDSDLTDVEKLQAAIEAGVDPTLEGEATAAGPGSGGSGGSGGAGGGHSFVLLGETGGALDPIIGFPTAGLNTGPEFPDPDPVVSADAPDFIPTIEIIYYDQEGSVVTGPGVVEEAALDGGESGDEQPGSNPASNAERVSGALVINSPDGISAIQVLDKDGVWINVQGGGVVQGTYGQLVFDAAGNWTYTLADNTLNHSNPDGVGADDQILDPFFVRVFDNDGDVSPTVPLTIAIYDDGPSILRFDISEQNGLLVVDESVGKGGSTKDESGHAQNNDETNYTGSESGVIGYASFNVESIFTLVVEPGADGENIEARTFSLTLSSPAADSGLTATAGGAILLSFVGGDGPDSGDILGIADGGLVVFRISINSSSGAVSVTQYAAIDHGDDGNNHDSMLAIGKGLVGVTVKVYDNDGDSATSESVELGSRIGFEDDGPEACIYLKGPWAQVVHDESAGLQNFLTSWWKPGDWDNDVSSVSAFNDVANKGSDIDPAGFARSLTPIVGTFGSSYGSDGMGSTVLSLELSGAQGSDSGLKTTDGTQINLYLEGGLVVGRVAGGDFVGQAAFAVAIGADGSISIVQYMSLQHPVGGSSYDEAVTLAGKIKAVVTVTDGDGDVAVDTVSIGHVIGFEDDGPVAQIKAVQGVRVVHDESHGLQNASATPASPEDANDNDINGIANLFSSVSNRGSDLSPKGYAQSNGPLVSTAGSSYGQDQEGATSKLSLAVVGGNGADSGLKTTAGFAVKLYVEGDLVVGRIVGGPDANKAAFAVAIGADGTVSVAQYVSLQHPIGGSSYDEAVSLTGKVQAVLTVTDGDGDVVVDKVNIGSAIRFEDDGPTASINLKGPWADVTHDETAGLQNFWTTWSLGDITDNDVAYLSVFDGVANKGSDISPTGFAKSATPVVTTLGSNYGEDEEGATTQLSLVVKNGNGDDSGLRTTEGFSITLHLEGALVVGRIAGGPDAGKAAFAIAIGTDGSLSLAQYVSLQHPIGGSSYDEAVNLAGKIQAVVTVTDGDGDVAVDKVDIGSVIRFEDDGPTARISLVKNAGVTHDESAGLQNATATPLISGDADDNDVADLSSLFAGVATPGTGLAAVGYAQSAAAVVSAAGSSAGQDDEGATTVLSLALQGNNGLDSGLKTTDGSTIRLYVEGELVVGRVDGGSDSGKAAFALAIGNDGKLSVAQYISLKHPDGSNADEFLSLSGKVKALLTITDGDGDVAVNSVNIGHVIRFEDDAPTAGQVTAAVVLDDEGLDGGINGNGQSNGDADGAHTSISGNLVFSAGADGLKSIVLSGPATLGSEAVSSSWDAVNNTLTISSAARGPLVSVVLATPVTGAYTVTLLKPLMHPVSGTEDDIILNIGYTVTDGDNDSATGSLVVTIDDDTPTIQAGSLGISSYVTFQGTDAGYSNSYGYYNKAPDGTPLNGKVIWADVHEQTVGDVASLDGLDPTTTGFFIIPDGGANAGLSNGSSVTFEFVAGKWVAKLGGVALVGADGANVLFSDASLNPGGSHLQDTGNAGNQNWEDKTLTSDYDYNDVSTNVTWGSSLQVDESNFNFDATASFNGMFHVQPGADGQQSLTYNLSVQNANSGLVDSETNQAVLLSMNGTVIEGRTSSNHLVFTLSVDAAGMVKLDQLRSIVHPTSDHDEATFLGAGRVSLTATVTDRDGDQASASLDIGTVISFKDDGPSAGVNNLVKLDDDALSGIPDGIGDDIDALNISGTLAHSFGADGAGSLQWLTTGAPSGFSYETGLNGLLLVKQGAVTVLTVTLDSATGAYSVTQNAPVLHATAGQENNQDFTFNYQVTDKDGDTANGTLLVSVDDDTPVARNDVASVQANQAMDFNVVFVLDFSGSIDNSELNTMLQAVRAAGQALFNGTSGDVSIQVVAFSGTAGAYPAVTNYAAFSSLIGGLNPSAGGSRPFDGNTDFTAAIEKTMAVFSPVPGASNQVFFISDGNPNEQTGTGGNSLADATAAAWNTFVDGKNVNVTTIGVGGGINNARLQDVDLDGSGAPIQVSNFSGLVTTLLGQIGALVSGNVLLGSDGVAGGGDDDDFGADGAGYIQSIVINNITYVWDGVGTIDPSSGPNIAGSQLSNITTAEGGKLSFNFSSGAWTYQAPGNVQADKTETFTYTIVDRDGDPSSATLTVYVEDTSPVVAKVDEDELPLGITDGDAVTTIATGNLGSLVVGPATGVEFSLSLVTSGLPAASSQGTPLAYSVLNNVLTATAGVGGPTVFTLKVDGNGDYTFTLTRSLDHATPNSDDNEFLTMDFASILLASKAGNPVALAGQFLVQIEDDIPTITAAQAGAGSLQVDETTLLFDDTTNFSSAFTSAYGADGAGSLVYSLNVSATGANSGLVDSASNQSILLYKEGANIVGKVGGPGGAVSFVVSVNSSSGEVTLDQQRALMHTPNTTADQAVSLSSANLVQLVATITDKDGDSASATLNLGHAISFKDDGPSISAGQAQAASLQVDETTLAINATANFSGAFTSSHGADGAGSLTYSLNVSATGANSGLVDSASNQSILLYKDGVNIVGKVGGPGGAVSFVVSVNSTGTVILDQQRALMHTPDDGPDQAVSLSLANLVQLVATITDKDADSASATLNLGHAISFKDDGPTVGSNPTVQLDDDALPGGLAGGSGDDTNAASTSGTLSFAYGADGAGSLQWLTTGSPDGFTYATSGSNLLVKQGATTVLTVTLNTATGAYSVTQNAPIKHELGGAENNQTFTLNYRVTDKDDDQATGSLHINVDDDTPVAKDIDRSGQANVGIKTNLMVVLDVSESMNDPSGVGSMSRLQVAKNALLELFEQYEALGAMKVTLVTFGSGASTNQVWVDIATAKSAVLALSTSGNTNYDAALINAINAYGQTGSSGGKLSGSDVQNVAYFLSDGAPNRPTGDSGIQTGSGSAGSDWPAAYGGNTGISEEQVWINFLTANSMRSYALGMGSGVTSSALEPIAYNGSASGGVINATVVTDFGQLTQTLTSLVQASPLGGNLSDNGGGFGADGGYVRSLTLGATTYTYDKASNSVNGGSPLVGNTLSIGLGNGSSLAVNMLTGSYLYTPPSTITTAIALSVGFTLMDNDGDPASANLSIAISAGSQPLVVRDDLVLTNSAAHSGNDVIDIPRWALLANDTGTSSSPLSVLSVGNSSSGTVALSGDNVLFTESGRNSTDGGSFSYTTSAGSANVVLDRSSVGSSTIEGTFRNEILLGRDGSSSHDILNGGDGDDILIGLGGNDTLNGGSGNDILVGGAGSDLLRGNSGDDILVGGLGADTMTGGSGKDIFLWQKDGLGGGLDHITDFTVDTSGANSDILDLSQLLSGVGTDANVLQNYLDFAFAGTTTTISVRTVEGGAVEQQVMLDNVNLSTLYGSTNEATIIVNMLDDNALKTA